MFKMCSEEEPVQVRLPFPQSSTPLMRGNPRIHENVRRQQANLVDLQLSCLGHSSLPRLAERFTFCQSTLTLA